MKNCLEMYNFKKLSIEFSVVDKALELAKKITE
jgi:hypothetical protein